MGPQILRIASPSQLRRDQVVQFVATLARPVNSVEVEDQPAYVVLQRGAFRQYYEDSEPGSAKPVVLFLHGAVPKQRRDRMVERFQQDGGGPSVFILSLKAGGTGLNLTGASHVFHFDRWWNPAVENQATDRAFRIGQKRNVLVHKFVCRGTIEERIDALIAEKRQVAEQVLDADGAPKLTELSDDELLRFVALDLSRATES